MQTFHFHMYIPVFLRLFTANSSSNSSIAFVAPSANLAIAVADFDRPFPGDSPSALDESYGFDRLLVAGARLIAPVVSCCS